MTVCAAGLPVATILTIVAATAASLAARQQPAFRSGVDVVSLNVTVTDPGSRYITDLEEAEFQVFEDGVKQELLYFNRSRSPIALSILLDTSASMDDKMALVHEAAAGFVARLGDGDIGQVIDFDSRVQILQSFTGDHPALERAIRQTTAGGSTALHNAVYIALKELKKIQVGSPDEIRRQAIVVLSDGEDTSSLVSFEEVLDLAKRSETAIYSIGIRSKDPSAMRGFREAEFVLRQLAQETGGRSFFPSNPNDLGGIYGLIAEELSSQYTLGYTSKNPRRDGMWRRIVVRLTRPDVVARTKQGYYAPTTP
jgi:Ca-activated chloride channel homolog